MEESRCLICGKKIHNPLSIYCAECEYELKRVRLEDEEPLCEWIEKQKPPEKPKINIKYFYKPLI